VEHYWVGIVEAGVECGKGDTQSNSVGIRFEVCQIR